MPSICRIGLIAIFLAAVFSLPAAADVPCANGTWWTFHSGQTGVVFSCTSPNNQSALAYSYAENACQNAWNQVDHLVSATDYVVSLNLVQAYPWSNDLLRWNYSCRVCLVGEYPPLLAERMEHELAIDAGDAGDIGGGLVGGVVVGVELKDLGDENGANFYVDVAKGTEIVQVIVDARSGEAKLASDARPGSCQAPR